MRRRRVICWYIIIYIIVLFVAILIAYVTDKAVSAISETTIDKERSCIIIDAGHGGVDGGATSCTGVLESNINLQISMRLNNLLHLLGYNTRMIRTTDISVYTQGQTIAQKKVSDLKERVRIINETDNALLLSIHQNNFSDSRYSGAQIFYPSTNGSDQLAKLMQTNFISSVNPGSRRLAKKCTDVYLMKHISCPGVLIECGFLSNPTEEALLRNDRYQKNICCVIASSVCVFLDRPRTS